MLRGPGSPWRRMQRARARLDQVIFAEIEHRRRSGELGTDILSLLLDAEAQFSGVDVQTVISRLLDAVAPPTDRVGA